MRNLFYHGQKFETRNIAQAHALENMASDNNITLLVIVHKKYNIMQQSM